MTAIMSKRVAREAGVHSRMRNSCYRILSAGCRGPFKAVAILDSGEWAEDYKAQSCHVVDKGPRVQPRAFAADESSERDCLAGHHDSDSRPACSSMVSTLRRTLF